MREGKRRAEETVERRRSRSRKRLKKWKRMWRVGNKLVEHEEEAMNGRG